MRPHLIDRDLQVFKQEPNWAAILSKRVDWRNGIHTQYQLSFAAMLVKDALDMSEYDATIAKLISAGYVFGFKDLPIGVCGQLEDPDADMLIAYFELIRNTQPLSNISTEIKSKFAKTESFKLQQYFQTQGISMGNLYFNRASANLHKLTVNAFFADTSAPKTINSARDYFGNIANVLGQNFLGEDMPTRSDTKNVLKELKEDVDRLSVQEALQLARNIMPPQELLTQDAFMSVLQCKTNPMTAAVRSKELFYDAQIQLLRHIEKKTGTKLLS